MDRKSFNQGEIDIKKFKKMKRINKGGFGVVYKVRKKKTGENFAAKVIDCNDDETKCEEIINREVLTKIQENDGPKDYTNTTRQIILAGVAQPVSLFGGYFHVAAISDKGEVIFINRNTVKDSPDSRFEAVSLQEGQIASSIACLENSIFVLCKSGRVLYSKSNHIKFKVDVNLVGKEIVCLSGTSNHCIAVTKEGRVFACSSNEYGQLGLYTKGKFVKEFTEISSLKGYEIQEAYAGHYHSLFMTRDGKIF